MLDALLIVQRAFLSTLKHAHLRANIDFSNMQVELYQKFGMALLQYLPVAFGPFFSAERRGMEANAGAIITDFPGSGDRLPRITFPAHLIGLRCSISLVFRHRLRRNFRIGGFTVERSDIFCARTICCGGFSRDVCDHGW